MKALYVLALVAALGFAGPALADCASDVKMAEANVMKVMDMKAKEMAMKELDMAKKAMMDKKEAECVKAAKMANDAAMMKK